MHERILCWFGFTGERKTYQISTQGCFHIDSFGGLRIIKREESFEREDESRRFCGLRNNIKRNILSEKLSRKKHLVRKRQTHDYGIRSEKNCETWKCQKCRLKRCDGEKHFKGHSPWQRFRRATR